MEVTSISTYSDLKKIFTELSDDYVFRGHPDSTWEINSTLFRNKFIEDKISGENLMIHKFEERIHLYEINRKIPSGRIEKLAYLQHYGAPTRLIDFTYSPYIATYFALRDSTENAALFAINYADLAEAHLRYIDEEFLKEHFISLTRLGGESIDTDVILKYLEYQGHENPIAKRLYDYDWDKRSEFQKILSKCQDYAYQKDLLNKLTSANKNKEKHYSFIFNESLRTIDSIIKVEPFYQNLRSISQSGCFLCQHNLSISFDNNVSIFEKYMKYPITKIIIPLKMRKEILRDLSKMNILESSMFPELEGFIRLLGQRAENNIT